jgi:4-amino-4-deoxy-L-arabinose transferase-like glycosyltransferase
MHVFFTSCSRYITEKGTKAMALQKMFEPEKLLARTRTMLVPHRLALMGITLVSIVFNFWMLGQNGYGNTYYAATVKSMGSNWHAFFFASLDPQGFVTVDKPPVGFWLQVLSTKIFGFTPFAVFFPQALAGVLSVLLLYWLIRRHFGIVSGLIAALALAVSPISVVTNRNNTIDSSLMLVLLGATWTTFRAIETGKIKWLIFTGILVGIGFNIKMLEAYLVIPAFGLAYLLGANKSWMKRAIDLAIAAVVLVVISLSWSLVVDLTPANLRPYVGSTQNNSELSLAFGYNGLQRLTGNSGNGGPGGGNFGGGDRSRPSGEFGGGFPGGSFGNGENPGGAAGDGGFPGNNEIAQYFREMFGNGGPGGAPGGQGGGGGMFNTGNPGLFRLFTQPLGGQIVWLLPLALIGMLALAVNRRFQPQADRQQQSLILWGTWLITMFAFFSIASFFHQYYLSQMAPAIAALAGIGIGIMWQQFPQSGWKGWLLPLSLIATAAEQIYIIHTDPSWGTWLIPIITIPTILMALVLGGVRFVAILKEKGVYSGSALDTLETRLRPALSNADTRLHSTLENRGIHLDPATNIARIVQISAVVLGLFAILAAPTVWSWYPARTNSAADLPQVGATGGGFGSASASIGGLGNVSVDSKLINYLEANQGSAAYLVAAPSSNTAAPIIIATGKAVMALGGFSGSDPILTSADVQKLVQNGTVRFFLLQGGTSTSTSTSDVQNETGQSTGEQDTPPADETGNIQSPGGPGGFGGGTQSNVTQWVQQNCTVVPTSEWQSTTQSSQGGFAGGRIGNEQLYDCKAS